MNEYYLPRSFGRSAPRVPSVRLRGGGCAPLLDQGYPAHCPSSLPSPRGQCCTCRTQLQSQQLPQILLDTGGKHKARWLNPTLHLVLSGPAPCFYPAAALSSGLTVKEQLHLYSPKSTFGPLKATARLMWPPVKMSLTPLH